jgi:hypothetical protein
MSARTSAKPSHIVAPSLLFGTMAVGLAVGLDSLGFWSQLDDSMTAWTEKLGDGMREVPSPYAMLLTMATAYLLPLLMLSSPHWWRRLVLWVSMLLITLAWVPVLALAHWKLLPCMPVVALCWSGLCAFIYALNQPLPCEQNAQKPSPAPPVVES